MSLSAPTSAATTYAITANTNQLDLAAELAEMIRSDNTVFISRLGEPMRVSQTRHYWDEDSLISNLATLNAALDASSTSVTVTSDDYDKFKVGTIFKFNEKGKTEVLRVTALAGTPTLTVERGHGSTSGETHADQAQIIIIAHTNQEDQDASGDDTQERSSYNNLTQVFQRSVRIPYTREKITNNGIASEFAHQVAYRMKEEMRFLNTSVINGVKSASAGSDSDYRSMGGLIEFVTSSGGNYDSTVENLSEIVVNDMAESIINDAGAIENGFILCSPKLRRVISGFDQAYRRGEFSQTVAGFYIERFITDMGFALQVIQDPWVPDDVLIMGDLNRIKLLALQGDEMRFEELAKTGRSYKGQITGQYSMKVENSLQAFAQHNNLS